MSGAMATPDGWADIPDELSAAGITDDLLVITELSFIKQLGWYDLWIVAVVSLIPCIPMLILFEWQRHRRTHFWPKARYQPGRGLSSQFPGIGAWAMGILRAPDEELMDVAGLEGFVFMRLMRMGCRLSLFGSVIAIPVTWIFLSEGDGSLRFLDWTVNVVVDNDWKLWAAVCAVWLVTLHTLYDVIQECEAFVKLRQQFLTKTEIMEDDPQATYSVMVERVPRECRADAALKAYFEHLFPGEVVCATIALADLGDLEKVLAERRGVLDALEHLRLEEEATGTAPQERLNLREGSYELVEAIPWYEAKLARLDERRRDLAAEIHKRSAEVEREATGTFFDRILATPQNLSTFGEGGKEDPVATGEGEREALLSRSVRRLDPTIATKHKSATGFVTFRSLRSCSVARQAQLSPRPFCMESCPQRPERKNLIWGNVPTSKTGRLVRHGFVSTVLVLLAMNWSSLIQICTYISHEWAPKHIPTAPYLVKLGYNIFSAYLPIMLVQAVLALLPFLYLGLAVFYERFKFASEVQQVVYRRYMLVQWANIYLSLVSGSIVTLVVGLVTNPLYLLEQLADLMPEAAVYFIELIIMKILLVLPFELSRIWPWFRIEVVARLFRDRLTERDLTEGAFEPPEFRYGFQYPGKIMVVTYALIFAGICPLVYPFALLHFCCAYLVYARQLLYVYVPKYETGGAFFETSIYTVLGSNLAGCFTFFAYLLLKEQYWHAWAVLVPTVGALVGWIFVSASYLHMNMTASIEIAVSADDSARSPPAFDQHWFRQPALDPNPDRVAKVEEPDDIHALKATPRRGGFFSRFGFGGGSSKE